MAYSRGSSSNIIVGAAALFTHDAGPIGYDSATGKITDAQALLDLPAMTASSTSYKETLSDSVTGDGYTNVGYTSNGLELAFQPDFGEVAVASGVSTLKMSAGDIGDVPLERGLVAVGPGSGSSLEPKERIYVAYRALSIENVTVSAKRDEASMFEVSFRLLPNDNASYGKIVDRSLD